MHQPHPFPLETGLFDLLDLLNRSMNKSLIEITNFTCKHFIKIFNEIQVIKLHPPKFEIRDIYILFIVSLISTYQVSV